MDNNSEQPPQKTMSAMEALEMIYSASVELNARLAEALEAMAAHRDIMVSEMRTMREDLGEVKRALNILLTTGNPVAAVAAPPAPAQGNEVKPTDFKWDRRKDPENPEEIFQKMNIRIPNR